jgi:hypothetical protein
MTPSTFSTVKIESVQMKRCLVRLSSYTENSPL